MHLMERYVLRCTPELFGDYDIGVSVVEERAGSVGDGTSLAGVVGFVGDLCGTLLLCASPELAAASHPLRARAAAVTERMQFDWVGELANQLMGRVKLRLADHGINLRVSAPISISAERLVHLGAAGETCRARFRRGSSEMKVWVDADLRGSLLWSEAFYRDREPEPAVEGTVTFL